MISPQLIEEIRGKTDIVAVISEFVKLRKAGKNYTGPCPFHSEKNPSFTVSPDKQLFHCFGCGEGGNVFSFLMKAESISFAEAVEELAAKVGIAVEKPTRSGLSSSEKDKLFEIMRLAADHFVKMLGDSSGQPARNYLKQRGISDETAKVFNLGFAPEGWDNLFKHLIARGAAPNLIERAGLTLPREGKDGYYDRFRNRLIFPVFDLRSRPVAFSGRAVGSEEPKYLNSPDTPVYRKGDTVFGLNFTKEEMKKEKRGILVEGNVDLLSVYQAGLKNVAAPLGTALTVQQCKLLARFCDTIVLAFDADQAGDTAAERSIELLRSQGIKVKVAQLQGAKDPDELVRKSGAAALRSAIDASLPFMEFRIRRALSRHDLTEIEARARALREVAQVLNSEPDPFVQKEYAKLAAAPLKVEAEAVLAEAKRLGFYRSGSSRDLRRVTEKPASRILEAERILLALAVEKKDFLEPLKAEVKIEDFISPEVRTIARLLYEQSADNPAHFLLENLPQESDRQFLARILMNENHENPAQVFDDCVKVVKSERSKSRVEAIKLALRAAEAAGEAQKCADLLSELKNEISI